MQTKNFVAPVAPLALTRSADRSITIHALGLDGPVELGTYASSADAWRAVDELDMGVEPALAAAA